MVMEERLKMRKIIVINLILLCLVSLSPAKDEINSNFFSLRLKNLTKKEIHIQSQAVESTGEINAKDNSTGTVLAGTTADLLLTLIADMSQAEPGEEIATIQILAPVEFGISEKAVTSVVVGGQELPNAQSVVDMNQITVSLPKPIVLTSVIEIEFKAKIPITPMDSAYFIVSLLNVLQNPIIVSIKEGNSDGRRNNDKLSVNVVAATKPDRPSLTSVQSDPGGENDLIISWTKVDDPSVSGYLVYPSDRADNPIDIPSREQTSYTDRNLEAGKEFSYTIRSYKTKALVSDASNKLSGVVKQDTKDPQPPAIQPEVRVLESGIEISWGASQSLDVVKYIIYRGSSLNFLEPIGEVEAAVNSYIDKDPPKTGSYIYVVEAVDDAGRKAKSSPTMLRQATAGAEPQPNPFTPLAADPRYNQVTFTTAIVEGGEGTFSIKIYDLEGDMVFEAEAAEGIKEIKWDGKDTNGEYVNSGIYVYQAVVGDRHKIGTIIVAK